MRTTQTSCLHLLVGLLCCAAPAAALGQSPPQPIRQGQYPGLDLCLNTCYGSCYAATGFSACWGGCFVGLGTCDAGCDVVCFFAPDSAACRDCLTACATQRSICEGNCKEAMEECHQACAATCIPQYTNSVGTPWFVGAPTGPDPITGASFQFGTLDYPYSSLSFVTREWDANPKTIYIESGLTLGSFGNGPFVINHPTWLINNTPENGPVRIIP